MNEPSSARTLLLEQLESRQLLAGGIFSHSGGHSNWDGSQQRGARFDSSPRDARLTDVRLTDVRLPSTRLDNAQFADVPLGNARVQENSRHGREAAANPPRADQPGMHPPPSRLRAGIPTGRATGQATSVAAVLPALSTAPDFPKSVLDGASANDPPPLSASATQSSIRVPVSSGGSITFLIVDSSQTEPRSSASTNSGGSSATANDPGLQKAQSAPGLNAVAVGVESDQGARDKVASKVDADSARVANQPSNDAAIRNVIFSVPSSENTSESELAVVARPSADASPSIEFQDGFRDSRTSPMVPFESFGPDDGEQASWELDRSTIDRLCELPESGDPDGNSFDHQNVIDPAMNDWAMNDRAIIDRAVSEWLGGPGGMIEIQRAGDVLTVPDLGSAIVEIPLDAIFGTHRWFELAASDQPPRDDTAVRDAVLAAINGVQADEVAPLHESAATRTDSLVYSGAALVAGTFAFARRRRVASMMATTNEK